MSKASAWYLTTTIILKGAKDANDKTRHNPHDVQHLQKRSQLDF